MGPVLLVTMLFGSVLTHSFWKQQTRKWKDNNTSETVISADGKTFTLTTTGMNPQGQSVNSVELLESRRRSKIWIS